MFFSKEKAKTNPNKFAMHEHFEKQECNNYTYGKEPLGTPYYTTHSHETKQQLQNGTSQKLQAYYMANVRICSQHTNNGNDTNRKQQP